jgi:hypothetical protein
MAVPGMRLELVVALMLVPVALQAESNLPLNQTVEGRLGEDSFYTVKVPSAGALTLVAHGEGGLFLLVTDEDGQALGDGQISPSNEAGQVLGTVALTAAGSYRVVVEDYGAGSGSRYGLAASFLAFPPLAREPDPDGRPSQARPITIGEGVDATMDSSAGDLRDWYVMTAPSAGTFTVVTRGPADTMDDLVLEAFLEGDFATPVQRSDDDHQGNRSSESVSVSVNAGQVMHVRVTSRYSAGESSPYRLSVGFIE